jgi:DNA-directed RNA polymerase specialized sigma24 family protein
VQEERSGGAGVARVQEFFMSGQQNEGPAAATARPADSNQNGQPPPGEPLSALPGLIRAYVAPSPGTPPDDTGRALAALVAPLIERIARRVAQGAGKSDREEFIEEALSLVLAPRSKSPPRIGLYRPEEGAFEVWLHRVLINCWRSRRRGDRRRGRELINAAAVPARPDSGAEDWPADGAALEGPFSEADLARLASWGDRYRVEVLCLAGLWVKVPDQLWESWLRSYEAAGRKSLPRPFPPDEFLNLDDPGRRTVPLARLLGYGRANSLSVRWHRGRKRLEVLDFIRHLRGRRP